MVPMLCAALVFASALWTTVRTERRYRFRWQSVEPPPVDVVDAVYRSAQVMPGRVGRAPSAIRLMALTCVLYGRMSLLALVVMVAGALGHTVHGVTHLVHQVVFAYAAGAWVAGAPALLMVAGMVLRAGTEILQRHPPTAYWRTTMAALAAAVLHALVGVRLYMGFAATPQPWVMGFIAASFIHAVALLGLAVTYRRELTARHAPR